jgi:tyrosyl-tRNA synthetase
MKMIPKKTDKVIAGVPIRAYKLLVALGMAKSNSEAKRLIRQGAMRVHYPKRSNP